MNKICKMFFVLFGAFGLMAGLGVMPAFAFETGTHVTKGAKVDVNNATEQELQELPGIGEVYAKKIIDGRPYKTEADLIKAGIPQITVDKIKDEIKFGHVKTSKTHIKTDSKEVLGTHVTKTGKVDVNHATEQELQALPGIGELYAKKIIEGRPYKTEADLVKAGIPQHTVDKIKDAIKFGHKKTSKTPVTTETKAASKTTKTTTSDETARVPPHKGMVWVNTESMVYHKEGDRWYGNTEHGKFMSEDEAIKMGAHISKQD